MTRPIATVLGGNGFIGRQVVERLVARGYTVRVASREPRKLGKLRRIGGGDKIIPAYASVTDATTLRSVFQGAKVGVNLVSILTESRDATFHAINAQGAGRAARSARNEGVERYVHVSAIGADHNSPSEYGRTKAEGEGHVRAAFPDAAIIRPSVVFGPEDRFLNMFAMMARFSPVMPVFCENTRFQPVYVGDVAEAIVRSLEREGNAPHLIEAGGPKVMTMLEIMRYVAQEVGGKHLLLPVPLPLAKLEARLFECLPGKLLTRDQLAMLQLDNVVSGKTETLENLKIEPTPLYRIAPLYLKKKWRFFGA
ncbi:complex I NDUFA9 subunit family protein [Kozakia baliensis]|uniref:complex I NDUFA9 subunit family protein n=1 Tax=Kozakia baliensis TaxID=153496 RepID=UPI000497975F|nr:complex I NDUFA9 subunit family protein [Kozakia baliensis]